MPIAPRRRSRSSSPSLAHAARRRAAAAWRVLTLVAGLACLGAVPVSAAHAQDYTLDQSVSLSGGALRYDLAETGTTALIVARVDAELRHWLVGDLGLAALRPQESAHPDIVYFVPEAQLQLQLRGRGLRPYVGAGGGFWEAVGPGRKGLSRPALSAAGGLRLSAPYARYGVRTELRFRQIGRHNVGRTAEWTAGVTLRF